MVSGLWGVSSQSTPTRLPREPGGAIWGQALEGCPWPPADPAGQPTPPGSRLPAWELLEAPQDGLPSTWPVSGTGVLRKGVRDAGRKPLVRQALQDVPSLSLGHSRQRRGPRGPRGIIRAGPGLMGEGRGGAFIGGAPTHPLFPAVPQGRSRRAQFTDEDAEPRQAACPKCLECFWAQP